MIPTADAALSEAKKICRKVSRRSIKLPCMNLLAEAMTTIMTAITCCNPVGQLESSHAHAMAANPVEMEFLLDSGAGRNLLSKDSMLKSGCHA